MRRPLSIVVVMCALALCSAQARAASDKPAKGSPATKPAGAHKPAKGHEAAAAKAHGAKAAGTKARGADARATAKEHGKDAAKEPDAHVTAAAPPGETARTESDLQALNERIQRRLAEAIRAQKPAAAGAASATSPRPRTSQTPAAPVAPRVQLIWRTEVAWPSELQDVPAPRLSVAWGDAAHTTAP